MEYKLKYESKEQAIENLHSLGITDIEGKHEQRRLALVWLGFEIIEPVEFNEQGEITKEQVYSQNYLVDILTKDEIFDFGEHEINPSKNLHKFA